MTRIEFAERRRAARPADLLRAALLAATLALSACGSPPRDTFDLARAAPGGAAIARPLRARLAVNEPKAIQPFDSERIVVRTGANEIANLAETQWADRLPRLVQSRLLESFDVGRSTGRVVRPGELADRALATEIRRFEIDLGGQEAVVEIAANILDSRGAAIGDGRVFVARAPAPSTTGAAAARALEEALSSALAQIVHWTAARV